MGNLLKIGIVGAGGIVRQRHLPGIRASGLAEIVAVTNSTLTSSRKFCEEFAPMAEAVENWQDLVRRPDIDIVWIGAAPFLHAPVTLAALDAGRHVFCQARMAGCLPDAKSMLEAARKSPELVTTLCPPPHGLEIDAFLRHLINDRIVGDLRSLRITSRNASLLDPQLPAHWRQRSDISGQNIMTLGIYAEVLHRWFGPLRVESASGRVFTHERAGVRIKIPDALVVLAGLQDGTPVCLEFSGVYAGPPAEVLELAGTKGILRVEMMTGHVVLESDGLVSELVPPPETVRPWSVEADFLNAVVNPDSPRPHPNFEDGVAYMEVIAAVWERLAMGHPEL